MKNTSRKSRTSGSRGSRGSSGSSGSGKRYTRKLPKFASTFSGIRKWYEKLFGKLGWMILAKEKGYNYKITSYKKSIEDLINTIEHVMGEYNDHNRIHDLNVLLMNTIVLNEYVKRVL